MKKTAFIALCLLLVLSLAGCGAKEVEDRGCYQKYYEKADGTWESEGNTYKYKLEITGRMSGAACDTTFVYLSNLEEITFDQAWRAAGLSSNAKDYFDRKDAVLVEWRAEQ